MYLVLIFGIVYVVYHHACLYWLFMQPVLAGVDQDNGNSKHIQRSLPTAIYIVHFLRSTLFLSVIGKGMLQLQVKQVKEQDYIHHVWSKSESVRVWSLKQQ